jgi:putative ABC transport system permease protein
MNEKKATRFVLRFLEWFCPPQFYEGIEGDLLEQFEKDCRAAGERKAKWRLLLNAARFFRPGILLRNKFSTSLTGNSMISNYVKVASRNILKRKLYSFINAFGLSTGIAFCVLIYLFIQDERSFDQFHANKDRIYRMKGIEYKEDEKKQQRFEPMSQMQLALAPVMKAELPEVEYATHFCGSHGILQHEDKIFNEQFTYVDPDFFKIFSFPLLRGNADKIFLSNDEIVLTPLLAQKYFGHLDVLGKALILNGREVAVTGIIEAPPANSSLGFQALVPIQRWSSYNQHNLDQWRNMGFATFVQVHANVDPENFQMKLDLLTKKYMGDILLQWRGEKNIPAEYEPYRISFTRLPDIHFENEIGWEKVSDPQYSWILGGIALLILLIACINYISLSLTTSARRRAEVGIRKVAGAYRKQLVYQFGVESIVLALISMVIGIGLVVLFLPAFNTFTGKGIGLRPHDWIALLSVTLGITLLVGVVAGCYPALFLSGFKPVQVLRGTFTAKLQAGFTRPLVVLQFALSAFLMFSSVIMYRQMRYVTTKDLGYDQHQIVIIPIQVRRGENGRRILEQFRQKASGHASIVSVTGTDYPFAGDDGMLFGYRVNGEPKSSYGFTVDPYYIKALRIQLVQGRDFDADNPADTVKTIIVNEALVRDMKWKDPLNEYLQYHGRDTTQGARVIGVVKDFHFLSLTQDMAPMFMSMEDRLNYILVKIDAENIPETLEQLRKYFIAVAPTKPFEYQFLDENVARQYQSFDRWTSIMGLSTVFAILISCLGLFGLAGINAVNRTKEIGIRKVLGADLYNVFLLLNKQYVWLSLIAFVLAAWPAWYAMNAWLASFQFRIEINWGLFAAGMLLTLLVALLTVSYHAIKAALINPAETLKYE